MTHKKIKIILSIVVSVFVVLVVAVVGGVWYMNNKFNQDMIRIANSEQANKVYEKGLKNLDRNAFTKKGVIKSYTVDEEKVKHNPMGGIDVFLVINNNNKLNAEITIDSYNDGKTIEGGGGSNSILLDKLIEENNKYIK